MCRVICRADALPQWLYSGITGYIQEDVGVRKGIRRGGCSGAAPQDVPLNDVWEQQFTCSVECHISEIILGLLCISPLVFASGAYSSLKARWLLYSCKMHTGGSELFESVVQKYRTNVEGLSMSDQDLTSRIVDELEGPHVTRVGRLLEVWRPGC